MYQIIGRTGTACMHIACNFLTRYVIKPRLQKMVRKSRNSHWFDGIVPERSLSMSFSCLYKPRVVTKVPHEVNFNKIVYSLSCSLMLRRDHHWKAIHRTRDVDSSTIGEYIIYTSTECAKILMQWSNPPKPTGQFEISANSILPH